MRDWLQRQWFERRWPGAALWLLLPLHGVFVFLSWRRKYFVRPERLPLPVVVVGNLIVGGAGKTPLTLWLAANLQKRGWRPGIVSRGYGGQGGAVRPVTASSSPAAVGDEPVLLAKRSSLPVFVGRRRAEAARALLAAHPAVDVILCDDGLQHLALGRDVEIAVFDRRGAGNGWRLPIGPLREPLQRLATVDAVVCNGEPPAPLPAGGTPCYAMGLLAGDFRRLDNGAVTCKAPALAGRKLHAVAGIGDPERFFATLAGLGLTFSRHPFPDHHAYTAADLAFAADGVLLMTEKDAVKCAPLVMGEAWYLPVEAEVDPALIELVVEKIRGRKIA